MTVSVPTHIPVMLKETLESLAVQPGGRYVDCTLGGGGHSEAILKHSSPGGQVLAIEADPVACRQAGRRLQDFSSSLLVVNDNFANLEKIVREHDFAPVSGILFDLGLSSLQLSSTGSGFSFQTDAPLDMRFNPAQTVSAADIVNTYSEAALAKLIYEYGEEPHSRQIARQIVRSRPIRTTGELAGVVENAVPARGRIHPATRTFQALRIAVNNELEHLECALDQAVTLLGRQGRLVVISYHSLEDRIVKNFMRRESADCLCPPGLPACHCSHHPRLELVNKRVVTPSAAEVHANPRSRSAKLRVAARLTEAAPVSGAKRSQRGAPGSAQSSRRGSARHRKLPVNQNMN